MNKNFSRICCILASSFYLMSCNQNNRLEQELSDLKSTTIHLCLDSMEMYRFSSGTRYEGECCDKVKSDYSIVVYFDSTTCASCAVKGLYSWFEVIDTLEQRYEKHVNTIFIFSPRREDLKSLKVDLKTALFEHPVYIDTSNVFSNRNKLPSTSLLHTFLINKDNQVEIAGDPLDNPAVRKLYYDFLDKKEERRW